MLMRAELAQIQSLREILSPSLILAFIALGILPWAGKGLVYLWEQIKNRS